MSTFAETLRTLRIDAGLSQSRLAADAHVDHSYVSRLESGHRMPTRTVCECFARALELSPDDTARLMESAGFVVDDLPALVRGEWGLVLLARLLADPDVSETAQQHARNLIEAAVTLCQQDAALWAAAESRAA